MQAKRRLKNISISRIALVDKGANLKDFALYKSKNGGNNRMNKEQIYSDLFVKKNDDQDELKVDREKVKPETFDSVIKLLDGNEDPDVKRAGKLLTVLKDKYGYPGSTKEKIVEKEAKPESKEDIEKMIDVLSDATIAKAGRKLSAKAEGLVKTAWNALKQLLDEVSQLKDDDGIKKFEEDHEEIDSEKFGEAVEASVKKALEADPEKDKDKE